MLIVRHTLDYNLGVLDRVPAGVSADARARVRLWAILGSYHVSTDKIAGRVYAVGEGFWL